MFRSIGAVVAGFAAWSVLWLGGNAAIMAIFADQFNEKGVPTGSTVLFVVLGWSVILSAISGWIAARIVTRKPVLHALITGIFLLAVGVAVQARYWDVMPLWYHLAFLSLIVPLNLVGGSLRKPAGTD